MSEKVEYFGQKDILIYLIACFVIGITIGVSFAHYKNVRLGLIMNRMKIIDKTQLELKQGYATITDDSRTKGYDEVQAYKGRSFDTGCTIQDGEFRFNVSYAKEPVVILANNGLLVNSTLTLGKIEQKVTWRRDREKIYIESIKPAAQEIHICWLAFPDLSKTPAPKI